MPSRRRPSLKKCTGKQLAYTSSFYVYVLELFIEVVCAVRDIVFKYA